VASYCFAVGFAQGGGDLSERQRTLSAAVRWSCEPLSPDEQLVLRRLALFTDGCSLSAVEAVCAVSGSGSTAFLDLVGMLIDKSLVLLASQPGGERRLRLMPVMREFALEHLCNCGELASV
jgi:predicted ATPase